MSTQRRRGLHCDLRTTCPEKRPAIDKYPGRRFPIQNEIRKLEDELNAFNDRIEELEDEGHRGYAIEVLKAKRETHHQSLEPSPPKFIVR